ncbi:MAG: ComF family protein [Oscillospiraceae bacterium]|nr:ComF family protein [Oscillospiraceae bacterium]
MYRLVEICRGAVSLVLPNRCPFCDDIVGMTEYWCSACYEKLPYMEQPAELPEYLDGLLSCCHYRGRARSAILRMKRGHYIYAPEAFAVMMAEVGGELIQQADIVTFVPSTFGRRTELGYAHAERIARDISRRGRKRCRSLMKISGKKQEQKKLNREERFENARNAYEIVNKKYIVGNNILIVDDVCTTGATLSAIAAQLKAAGAAKVFALTFAQA